MTRLYYEVNVSFTDRALAAEWLRWMEEVHLTDVLEAGASAGRVVRLDNDSPSESHQAFVAQYEFVDRDAFETYLRDHAPRLRAEGLARFPPDKAQYTRRIGQIIE